MTNRMSQPFRVDVQLVRTVLCLLIAGVCLTPHWVMAQQLPQPYVAIHVSELTQTLETTPAVPPTPTGTGTTGYQWWNTSWRYFVAYESLKEALRSDGTPFVTVSDSDIAAGKLLNSDGLPAYPIVISLVSEAIADNEIAPLRNYVNAGGFLLVGSSAFTRNPNGTTRGDFALATEMGVHMVNPTLTNWYLNGHFTKGASHRLTSHIPDGTLEWIGPLKADEIAWGVSPTHVLNKTFNAWQVVASGATVIANGDLYPLLTVKSYGLGQIIYHGEFQPLIVHGGYTPGMYAYLIYRKAIEWAFESFTLPIVKVSPWPYQYDAAFIDRHDFENSQSNIRAIESSAQFEHSLGIKGDYYFCTGALRADMGGDATTVASLRRAVSNYGATIGSHNGGLKNPVNASLLQTDYDYWHWGPDEALDTTPPGYATGKAYALASIQTSFLDIQGWLNGLDNGRPGCGAAGNCPRTWVAPYFNSTREDSRDIMDQLGSVIMGEQKISPFPHRTLSYKTPGKYFTPVTLPVSDWYVGPVIAQAVDDPFANYYHTTATITAAVDFYYNLGSLINIYTHSPTNDGGVGQQYATYSMSKTKLWSTNSVGVYDWWRVRSNVTITPAVTTSGGTYIVTASVAGATDPTTAVEIVLPQIYLGKMTVFLNGTQAGSSDYRTTSYGMKVQVGTTVSSVRLQNVSNLSPVAMNDTYTTTAGAALNQAAPGVLGNDSDPEGAALTARLVSGPSHGTLTLNANGSFLYTPAANYTGSDSFTYVANDGTSDSSAATVTISTMATLVSLSVDPASVTGGSSAQGTVTLSGAAPSGGAVISLSDTSSAVTVPASVMVAAGSTSATFTIGTSVVTGTMVTTISAVYGGVTKTAALTVDLFSDDFARAPGAPDPLAPWSAVLGTWTITNGVLQGSSTPLTYAALYTSTTPLWTDYTVQGSVQFPAGAFGGGISGRVNPASGARYGAWVYPVGSIGGSNVLKLVKFSDWTTWSGTPMQQVSLPNVGTDWHTLKMAFAGNQIQVYFDGTLMIDVTDNNFDSRAPYLSGGISGDLWTYTTPYVMGLDNVAVSALSTDLPPVAMDDAYSTLAGTALNQAAPGVLGNDSDPEGAALTARLASGPAHGTLTLNANGSFLYTPAVNYTGSDSFTYVATDGTSDSSAATVTITVLPATVSLVSLALDPASVTGGSSSQGTVTLSGAAPSGGVVVSLSDTSTAVTVPASVTVPGGSSSATFTITTTGVTSSTTATISAVYSGVTKTATLTVTPPAAARTVSGTISPAPSGAGATLALTQGTVPVATVTAASNGTYSFASVANGTYAITPIKAGFTFTPVSASVTVNGADVTGVNFTATGLAIDVTTSTDTAQLPGSTIATPAFSTRAGNELLLAFIPASYAGAAPNITVTGVSGGGLTWTLVRRTNTQQGTAEIWRAFASAPLTNATVTAALSRNGGAAAAITVVAFAGVNSTTPVGAVGGGSAATGRPTASLTTQGTNSWVFGVGNDWDGAVARTVGANQTMVHQYLSSTGDTFWAQRQNATAQPAGTVVTINDTAPTNHQWNLSIVEVRQ